VNPAMFAVSLAGAVLGLTGAAIAARRVPGAGTPATTDPA